mgnify:CR=1 FL=1
MNIERNLKQLVILSFPEYQDPAYRLSEELGVAVEIVEIHHFPDGESLVKLPKNLPKKVAFLRSLDSPNDKLIELMLAAETARSLGVDHLTLIAPYLCYMRQDIAFHEGEAVSQQIIGRFLARHFDSLITISPHLHRTHSLTSIVPEKKSVVLNPFPQIAAFLKQNTPDALLLGPDEESEQWVSQLAKINDQEYSIAQKLRSGDTSVSIALPKALFRDREVVIVDDIVSTGRTLIEVASSVAKKQPKKICAFAIHPLFVDGTLELILQGPISAIWSCDTIVHSTNSVYTATPVSEALSSSDIWDIPG